MKDLYTFDLTKSAALQTYKTVRDAYSAFFDDLKVPYLTAEADSGSIGGDLSHEYHIANHKGEDNVISCSSCSYVANEEVVYPRVQSSDDEIDSVQATFSAMASEVDPILQNLTPFLAQSQFAIWTCLSRDRETKYVAVFPSQVSSGNERFARDAKINIRVMKRICKDIDLTSANETLQTGSKTHPLKEIYVFDYRVSLEAMSSLRRAYTGSSWPRKGDVKFFPLEDLVEIEEGDCCPKCGSGTVKVQPSVELGHTFYLGTKYSRLLEAEVLGRHSVAADFCNATSTTSDPTQVPESPPSQELASTKSYIEMGCHGIGVSRLIAAIADHLTDSKGLNWPRVIAPFEAVIIPAPGFEEDAELILDQLSTPRLQHSDLAPEDRANLLQEITPGFDVILDDRPKVMAWKLRDADLIGYPVIVVLGRAWPHERKCEVQCRRLDGYKRMVPLEELRETIQGLLARL
ncbi:hypothetical protein MMC13_004327 [Lambiella insularis]|nr:hypothetical protein [Lambiella insularis]